MASHWERQCSNTYICMSLSHNWNTWLASEEKPPLSFATFGSFSFLNSMAATWRLWPKPSWKRSLFCGSRCINGPCSYLGTWEAPIWEVHSTWCSTDLPDTVHINVAMLANWTCLWGVTRTSASVRISLKVSLLIVGGTWPALDAAPLFTFMVPGRWSTASCLSWPILDGACEISWWSLSGKGCKIYCCSTSRVLNLCNSFSCLSTLCIAWSCICERAATCALWACSSLIICSTFSLLHPECESFLEHLPLPPIGTLNYHGAEREGS